MREQVEEDVDPMDGLGDVGRPDRRAGVVIDEDVQERLIADFRSKLTSDSMLVVCLFGFLGFVSLLSLIGLFRDPSASGAFWLMAVATLLSALVLIRTFILLRVAPRKAVVRAYPIGSSVEAGFEDGYLRHTSALGSTRTVIDLYSKLTLTADSVMLKPRESPITMTLPRRAFAEEDVRALEAHFAPKDGG